MDVQAPQDVTWSDGTTVLPSDFKFGWERVVAKNMASEISYHVTDNLKIKGAADVAAGKVTDMTGIVADDANMTLKVTLDAPLSFLPNVVAHSVFSRLAQEARFCHHRPDQVGAGCHGRQRAVQDARALEARPVHQACPQRQVLGRCRGSHKAYLNEVDFIISKDLDSAFAAFEAGTGQTGRVPSGRFGEIIAKYTGHNTTAVDLLGTYYWGFNQKDATVGGAKNLALRQAISLAVDRDAINKTVYNNSRQEQPASLRRGCRV